MGTPDDDWVCDEDESLFDYEAPVCFAVWQFCDMCEGEGHVAQGHGVPIPEGVSLYERAKSEPWLWKRDMCVTCTGTGGGYICGIHDADD